MVIMVIPLIIFMLCLTAENVMSQSEEAIGETTESIDTGSTNISMKTTKGTGTSPSKSSLTTTTTTNTSLITLAIDLCQSCLLVVSELRQKFEDQETPIKFANRISSMYCVDLPTINRDRICRNLIQRFFPQALNQANRSIDKKNVCDEHGFCGAKRTTIHTIIPISIISEGSNKPSALIQVSINCKDCIYLIESFHRDLQNETLIVRFLDLAYEIYCSVKIERAIACYKLLDEIFKYDILQWLLEKSRDARVSCATIKECDSKATISSNSFIYSLTLIILNLIFNHTRYIEFL